MSSSRNQVHRVEAPADENCEKFDEADSLGNLLVGAPTSEHLAKVRAKVWEIDGIIQDALMEVPPSKFLESQQEVLSQPSPCNLVTDNWGELAKLEYKNRRVRDGIFHEFGLFGEPAWDILLDLFFQEYQCKLVSITSASIASCAPPTTALRWIGELERKGFIYRQDDPKDCRRSYVRLTVRAVELLRTYFTKRQRDCAAIDARSGDYSAIPLAT